MAQILSLLCFFFNDTATTEIYTLSLHDALPFRLQQDLSNEADVAGHGPSFQNGRSEEHTSELQSQFHLVCRLLLEKKKHQGAGQIAKVTKNILKQSKSQPESE